MSVAQDANPIFEAALALPRDLRVKLVQELLISVELAESKDADYDKALREELQRRRSAYERGEMPASDWRDAIAEIRQQLRSRRTA